MTTATMTKTADAQPMGIYQPTSLDAAKAQADVRIIDAEGTFTVRSNVALSGRGVVARGAAGTYEVTKSAMKRIEKTHNVVCDF